MRRYVVLLALAAFAFVGILNCRQASQQREPTPTNPSGVTPGSTRTQTPTPSPSPDLPIGFPLQQTLRPMRVMETPQGLRLAEPLPDGPTVVTVARDYHTRPENDLESNRYGWNCRVHDRHEGGPAVDWYLPTGTPVMATMRGQAELFVITPINGFAYYGVDPRIYLGLPSPSLPLYPFPGPGGGMGIFVSILNGDLRAEYGHLDLTRTLTAVPESAFVTPYSRSFAYDTRFDRPLQPWEGTIVARWQVNRGDTVGYVGNTGYSDVSHLHYQIVTSDRMTKFCPTEEQFPSSGWLFKQP